MSIECSNNTNVIKVLVEEASATINHEILLKLSKHTNMNIRRAVARNMATPRSIIDELANDPTLNVCVKALTHRNCSVMRKDTIKESLKYKCAICDIPEIETFNTCSDC